MAVLGGRPRGTITVRQHSSVSLRAISSPRVRSLAVHARGRLMRDADLEASLGQDLVRRFAEGPAVTREPPHWPRRRSSSSAPIVIGMPPCPRATITAVLGFRDE